MSEERLKNSFEIVKRNFFPEWDLENNWVVRKDRKIHSQGLCERSTKTITIRYIPYNQNRLYWFLIHEICHAVSTDSHSREWEDQMLKASKSARKNGNDELSRMILNDLEKLHRRGELDEWFR